MLVHYSWLVWVSLQSEETRPNQQSNLCPAPHPSLLSVRRARRLGRFWVTPPPRSMSGSEAWAWLPTRALSRVTMSPFPTIKSKMPTLTALATSSLWPILWQELPWWRTLVSQCMIGIALLVSDKMIRSDWVSPLWRRGSLGSQPLVSLSLLTLLHSGGYLLTQIPIIDGLRRSGDDEDLGFGRTYDEFDEADAGFDYDVSVGAGGDTNYL